MLVDPKQVERAVEAAIPLIACRLPRDVHAALAAASAGEDHLRGAAVLSDLIRNAAIASEDGVPICQDTGTVWVCLEFGPDMQVPGDVLSGVDAAVARAYEKASLRRSVVRDALLDRTNSGDNTPAFTELLPCAEPGCLRLHVMLKGGGSDNASKVEMLVPGAGREGVMECVVSRVREKASSACAPLVVGVGIGATFDKVAALAKHALMRPVGTPAADEETSLLERELMVRIAEAGIGPGGLGGRRAALAVHVETAPCHIAALPVAINMGCSALRRATIDLCDPQPFEEQVASQLIDPDEARRAASRLSGAASGSASGEGAVRIELPRDAARLADLSAGERCLLSGTVYTLRDAGHARLLEEMGQGSALPYNLDSQAIFYAGPTPAAADRPFGAVGPTTAGRMDFAAPALYDAGIVATIGKGARNTAVREACARNGAVYLVATGGAAALLAKQVSSAEVVAYEDLGTEALRRLEIVDFPVFIGIDSRGRDVYEDVQTEHAHL